MYYSQVVDHVYENLEDFYLTKKRKVIKIFDVMIRNLMKI